MEVANRLNIEKIREDFPILQREVNGYPLVYFDSAATTQKPTKVIKAIDNYYRSYNSNIHRGIHTLAEKATAEYEKARETIQKFINAGEHEEVIITSGTTESINLVASSYGRKYLKEGDEVLVSGLEHHSNIVPWQLISEEKDAKIKSIPVLDDGSLDLVAFENLLSSKTKIVAVNYASNSLGTINPIKQIIDQAHEVGAVVLIDGAQAMSHIEVDVQYLDCDFFAFSGHKVYGPTGIGGLYGKRQLLESMPPYQGGGEMIREVSFEGTTFNDIPYKFEAGTPNIADTIGLGTALEYVSEIGKAAIAEHEQTLTDYAMNELSEISGVNLVGTAKEKVSVVSFTIDNVHHFDAGMMLDATGIAVRTGHHCTQPLMESFNLDGTIRASFAVYNTMEEIERLITSVKRISERANS